MSIRWPLLVGTSISDAFLNLMYWPNSPEPKFGIGLNYRVQIARLDFAPNHEWHDNPINRARLLGGARIYGPHYHSWEDNRHLATAAALSRELTCARQLPAQIKRWDQAFRWFCGEVGIVIEAEVVEPPPRSSLL